jgi:WD40 repeat protein
MARKQSLFRKLADWLFGYDFFISYAWADGRNYALQLNDALEQRGFDCFLDSEEYASGDDWKKIGERKLQKTGQLILLLTPHAYQSQPVLREVKLFSKTERRIIPIEVDVTSLADTNTFELCQYIPDEILRIKEQSNVQPSEATLSTLINSFDLVRQQKKRIRLLTTSSALFLAVAIVAIALGWSVNNTNKALVKQQVKNHAQLLYLTGEKEVNQKEPNFHQSTLLALASYQKAPDAKALNMLSKNIAVLPIPKQTINLAKKTGNFITFSPNGHLAATYRVIDKAWLLTILNSESGQVVATHQLKRSAKVVISPNNKYFAILEREQGDDYVALYQMLGNKLTLIKAISLKRNLAITDDSQIKFSKNSEKLLLSLKTPNGDSAKHRIKVFNSHNGQLIKAIDFDHRIKDIDFTDKYFVYASKSTKSQREVLRLFDWQNEKVIHGISAKSAPFRYVSISNDGKYVVAQNRRNIVIRKITPSKLAPHKTIEHWGQFFQLRLSPDSKKVAVTSWPGTTTIYHVYNGKMDSQVDYNRYTNGLTWLENQTQDDTLITANFSKGPHQFNHWALSLPINKQRYYQNFIDDTIENAYQSIQFSAKSKSFLIHSYNNDTQERMVEIFSYKNDNFTRLWHKEMKGFVAALSFDGQYVALDDTDGQFSIYKVADERYHVTGKYADNINNSPTYFAFTENNQLVTTIPGVFQKDEGMPTKLWLPNGERVGYFDTGDVAIVFARDKQSTRLVSSSNFDIKLWDLTKQEKLFDYTYLDEPFFGGERIWNIAFQPDGKQFIHSHSRGESSGALVLRNSKTGEIVNRIALADSIVSIDYSPNGDFLYVLTASGTSYQLDSNTLAKTTHRYNLNKAQSQAISPDGKLLATASSETNGAIRIWDTTTGELINEHSENFLKKLYWIENDILVGAGSDKLSTFNINPDVIINQAKRRLYTNFSIPQWLVHFPNEPYKKLASEQSIPILIGDLSITDAKRLFNLELPITDQDFALRMLYWATRENRPEYIPWLKQLEINLDQYDNYYDLNGFTPLNLAIHIGNVEVFKALVEAGASMVVTGEEGRFAWYSLLAKVNSKNHNEAIEMLEYLLVKKHHIAFIKDYENKYPAQVKQLKAQTKQYQSLGRVLPPGSLAALIDQKSQVR